MGLKTVTMDIQLIIKAPNQNVEDQVIPCNLDWNVLDLKIYLSEVYPNNPPVQEQKLIYSGHLLHDHLQLKDFLRQEDDNSSVHTLHLVCYERNDNEHMNLHMSKTCPTHMSTNEAGTSTSNASAAPSPESTENELRHRNNPMIPQLNFQPQFPLGTVPAFAGPMIPSDPQFLAQMAAVQQMYAYYMTQYMQSMNAASVSVDGANYPNISSLQQPPNNVNYVPNDVPAQRPVNQRMNMQGGQIFDDNDEWGHRDWLDHAFLCCRFFLIMTVVYFYSTPERLMIVIVCATIAFLYHEGWFFRRPFAAVRVDEVSNRRNGHNRDVNGNAVNNANEQAVHNPNLSANEELHDGHELEAAMDGDNPPHAQQPDGANNNQMLSPFTFVAAFFSSLIPEPPPPVNAN